MLVDLAIKTALKYHAGGRRKGTNVPYVVHPLALGMIFAAAGCSEEVIAAGILHDTIEDTSLTAHELRETFGSGVALLVAACTEPDKSLPWETRKEHTLASMEKAPLEARLIVCADKLHNVRTIAEDREKSGESIWGRFNRGKSDQEWYYRGLVRVLCNREDQEEYASLFTAFKEAVEDLFSQ